MQSPQGVQEVGRLPGVRRAPSSQTQLTGQIFWLVRVSSADRAFEKAELLCVFPSGYFKCCYSSWINFPLVGVELIGGFALCNHRDYPR